MPPRQKTEPKPEDFFPPVPQNSFLRVGMLVHLVSGGRTLQNYEVLDWDDKFIKFRGSEQIAPQTQIVLIPQGQIEAIGLVGEY